jgi:hypothetical protein
MKIIVPMRGHISGLHEGHIALIEYAKTLSDDVVVWISSSIPAKECHYFHGQRFETELNNLTTQEETIKSLGVKIIYQMKPRQSMDERNHFRETKKLLLERVEGEWGNLKAGLLKNIDIFDRHRTMAMIYVMGHIRRQHHHIMISNHSILLGPEPVSFILKSWKKMFDYLPQYLIFPKVIKKNGLKIGSLEIAVPREQWEELEKVVYTGDFVDGGRLEYTLYNTNLGLIEDITYDKE